MRHNTARGKDRPLKILIHLSVLLAVFGCASPPMAQEKHVEKQRFVIVYSPGPHWLAGKAFWEQPLQAHGAYMHQLYTEGKLAMGGPFTDSQGGLAVLDVADQTEAQQIVADDPAVERGIFIAKPHPWFQVDWQHYGS